MISALEKSGIDTGDLCLDGSNRFWENDSYTALVRDHPSQSFALVGTSEGGPTPLELAARNPAVDRAAIISAGGMTQRDELNLLAEASHVFETLRGNLRGQVVAQVGDFVLHDGGS